MRPLQLVFLFFSIYSTFSQAHACMNSSPVKFQMCLDRIGILLMTDEHVVNIRILILPSKIGIPSLPRQI